VEFLVHIIYGKCVGHHSVGEGVEDEEEPEFRDDLRFPPPPPLPLNVASVSASTVPPDARSILIQGTYPATAIIHHATSCLADSDNGDSKVLILSPSKDRLHDCFRQFNDKWLNDQAGNRSFLALLDRISILLVFRPPALLRTQ